MFVNLDEELPSLWITYRLAGKLRCSVWGAIRGRILRQNHNPAPMDSFWNHCLRHFEKALPAQQYKTWIQPLHAHLDQHTVVVSAPNRFVLEWVKDKFVSDIERLSAEYLRKPVEVVLNLSEKSTAAPVEPLAGSTAISEAPPAKPKIREQTRLN